MTYITINTTDSLDYRYFPVTKSRISVSVKAAHDARISLRTHLGEDSNVYEIIIGGWGNTMSAIKRNNQEPDVAEAETRDILDTGETLDLLIQWYCDGLLTVGRNVYDIFMSYKDRSPFVINYIGVSTAWGATGEWIIEESQLTSLAIRQQLMDTSHLWVDYNDFGLPPAAVIAYEDGLYIGRTQYKDSVTPGGIRGNTCTIAWGGIAHERKDFQVLCAKEHYVHWVKSWEGSVPLHALPAGETEDGYALFIGRVFHGDTYYVGKIQPNHQVCYVPVNGHEVARAEYDVLVLNEDYVPECIGR